MMPFALLSLALLGIRLFAASKIGFGDSEALYATYAAHPQPAYLDHPGLVGMAMKAIGPTPERVHNVTSVIATMIPWFIFYVARSMGATQRAAMFAAIAFAFVPEISVGLFGMTPDLLLAPLWIGAIGLAHLGLSQASESAAVKAAPVKRSKYAKLAKERAESVGASVSVGVSARVGKACFLGAGLLAGVACSAKASGVLLVLALVVVYARSPFRKSAAPWVGLLAGSIVLVPVIQWEAANGFPMFRHRLVETQAGAGVAFRNLGVLLGGQLLYLSPGIVFVIVLLVRDLWKNRAEYPLLFWTFAIPFVPLVVLCIWSRVAEPHWLAPAFLSLALYAAIRPELISRRVYIAATSIAGVITVAAHAYVLIPESAKLVPGGDPKYDIANELYGWQTAVDAIENQRPAFATPWDPTGSDAYIVAPHWTLCAQVAAAMPTAKVGCATPVKDDFDRWLPRAQWKAHDRVIWITDNRYPDQDGQSELPDHVRVGQSRVRVFRGGKSARTFEVFLYDKRAGAMVPRPASLMSAMSSFSDGFGVVSSVSP